MFSVFLDAWCCQLYALANWGGILSLNYGWLQNMMEEHHLVRLFYPIFSNFLREAAAGVSSMMYTPNARPQDEVCNMWDSSHPFHSRVMFKFHSPFSLIEDLSELHRSSMFSKHVDFIPQSLANFREGFSTIDISIVRYNFWSRSWLTAEYPKQTSQKEVLSIGTWITIHLRRMEVESSQLGLVVKLR